MTSIYLWGDSWAKSFSAQLLQERGYTVKNLSTNGAGNFHSIHLSQRHESPDYVIWYHTEMLRDLELMTNRLNLFASPYTYQQALHDIANKIYELASLQLSKWKKTKLIVLQAQSPVVYPEFEKWINPFAIKNWRKEIYSDMGKTLQNCYHLSTHIKISDQQCNDPVEYKSLLLQQVKDHYDEMCANDMFPDNGHPSKLAHEQLIEWFVKMDQGTL